MVTSLGVTRGDGPSCDRLLTYGGATLHSTLVNEGRYLLPPDRRHLILLSNYTTLCQAILLPAKRDIMLKQLYAVRWEDESATVTNSNTLVISVLGSIATG